MAADWNLKSVLKSWAISLTKRWKGSFLMSSSVDFSYLLISRRATVPGLYLCGFFTPPSTAAGVLFWAGMPDLPAPGVGFLWEALFCHSISCCMPWVSLGTGMLLLVLWLYLMIKSSMSLLSHPLAITACWRAGVNPLSTKTISSSLPNLCVLFFSIGLPMFPWCNLRSEWHFSVFEFSLHVQGPLLHADWLSDFPMGGPFPKVRFRKSLLYAQPHSYLHSPTNGEPVSAFT